MSTSRVTVRVRRPAKVVFDAIASHAWTNEPAWEPEVLGVQPDDGGLRVGGRVAMTRKDMGKIATTTYEITKIDAPRSLAVRHIDGTMDFALDWVVAPASPTESDVTVTVDMAPRGALRVMAPLFALMGPKRNARISADMVKAIEASA